MSDTTPQPIVIERYTDADVLLEDGTPLPLRFTPFTRDQFVAFMAGFEPIEHPESARAIYRKADEADLPWPAVRERRLSEMSADQRAAHTDMERREADHMLEFFGQAITTYVRIKPTAPPVVVVDEAGERQEIRTGAEIAETFSGDPSVLGTIVRTLAQENALSLQKKTNSRRRSASRPSSMPPPTAASGSAPAATAASAEPPPASATSADASALPELSLSSATA